MNQVDPLDWSPLEQDWRMEQYDIDEELSLQTMFCAYRPSH